MKLICNRGALLEALNVAGNAIATRTPKPALQCVKLTASADKLIVAATDLEVAIRYQDAQVQVDKQVRPWFHWKSCARSFVKAWMTRFRWN